VAKSVVPSFNPWQNSFSGVSSVSSAFLLDLTEHMFYNCPVYLYFQERSTSQRSTFNSTFKRPIPKGGPMSHTTLKKSLTPPDVLEDEIKALREIFHDLVKIYRRTKDLKTRLAIADRIAIFSARISQLARAQHFISPPPDPFLAELDAACEAVTKEWPVMELFRPSTQEPPAASGPGENSSSPLSETNPPPH
jgi:hypothetical protein